MIKRILVTRAQVQNDSFMQDLTLAGFEPVNFPVLDIRLIQDNPELVEALTSLSHYDLVIYTSLNGVEAFWYHLNKLKLKTIPENVRVAAVGSKTAEALRSFGVTPHFVPGEFISDAFLPGLGDLKGRRVLLPRSDIALPSLPEAIKNAGGIVNEIVVYCTLPARVSENQLADLRSGVDLVTFTSPSTVHNFTHILKNNDLDPFHLPGSPEFACIGPTTRKAALEAGFHVSIIAQEHTTRGLIDAIHQANLIRST